MIYDLMRVSSLFSFISDYDDRLAAAEQIFWQSKIPQMYLWKLRHLQSKCKLEKLRTHNSFINFVANLLVMCDRYTIPYNHQFSFCV